MKNPFAKKRTHSCAKEPRMRKRNWRANSLQIVEFAMVVQYYSEASQTPRPPGKMTASLHFDCHETLESWTGHHYENNSDNGLFHATDMRSSKNIMPKQCSPCNSRSHKRVRVIYFFGKYVPETSLVDISKIKWGWRTAVEKLRVGCSHQRQSRPKKVGISPLVLQLTCKATVCSPQSHML